MRTSVDWRICATDFEASNLRMGRSGAISIFVLSINDKWLLISVKDLKKATVSVVRKIMLATAAHMSHESLGIKFKTKLKTIRYKNSSSNDILVITPHANFPTDHFPIFEPQGWEKLNSGMSNLGFWGSRTVNYSVRLAVRIFFRSYHFHRMLKKDGPNPKGQIMRDMLAEFQKYVETKYIHSENYAKVRKSVLIIQHC